MSEIDVKDVREVLKQTKAMYREIRTIQRAIHRLESTVNKISNLVTNLSQSTSRASSSFYGVGMIGGRASSLAKLAGLVSIVPLILQIVTMFIEQWEETDRVKKLREKTTREIVERQVMVEQVKQSINERNARQSYRSVVSG